MIALFTLARFSFQIRVLTKTDLPVYKGSTFRGAFGHSFKRIVCAARQKTCVDCLLKERCVYAYIFESIPTPELKPKQIPHPFILTPPLSSRRFFEPGERMAFELILVGNALASLPYFIYTFKEMGQKGIGRGRGTFALEDLTLKEATGDERVIYEEEKGDLHFFEPASWNDLLSDDAPDGPLTINFITPMRLKYHGSLVGQYELAFHMLIRALLRRISALAEFHCGFKPDFDYKGLVRKAQGITMTGSSLAWHDWERYSARQNRRMKLGGLIGTATFEGDLQEFWPLLRLGEVVHAGKGSTFGLGRYSTNPDVSC